MSAAQAGAQFHQALGQRFRPIGHHQAGFIGGHVLGALAACCIWVSYMLQSRRVKVTFVR